MNSDIESLFREHSLDEILDGLANYCRTKVDETFDDPTGDYKMWLSSFKSLKILAKKTRDF